MSITPSTFGFLPDLASTSPTSVRGSLKAASTKNLLLSSVITVMPSAMKGGRPPAWSKCGCVLTTYLIRLAGKSRFVSAITASAAGLALAAFEHDDVILELDGQ